MNIIIIQFLDIIIVKLETIGACPMAVELHKKKSESPTTTQFDYTFYSIDLHSPVLSEKS